MRLDPHDQRIETARGGLGLTVLGLLIALISGAVAYIVIDPSVVGGNVTVNGRAPHRSDAWVPFAIAIVGLALAGIRWRTEIDIGARRRTRHRRFWLWTTDKQDALGEPQRVTLRREQRGSGKNSRTVHVVRLVTTEGEFEVATPSSALRGRGDGETVAKLCNVPLHDRRGGAEIVRQPDELDRSVIADDDSARPVGVPSPCRVKVERRAGRTVIRVPSPAVWFLPLGLIPMLLPVGFFVFFWLPGMSNAAGGSSSTVGRLFWLGLPLAMCILPLGMMTVAAYRSGLLPHRIVIERGALLVGRARFDAMDLEELQVATGPLSFWSHVRAVSDEAIRPFGRGLSTGELEYLRWVILEALRSSR